MAAFIRLLAKYQLPTTLSGNDSNGPGESRSHGDGLLMLVYATLLLLGNLEL